MKEYYDVPENWSDLNVSDKFSLELLKYIRNNIEDINSKKIVDFVYDYYILRNEDNLSPAHNIYMVYAGSHFALTLMEEGKMTNFRD